MNDIRIRDTIRDKNTGITGTVISDSPFMGMYNVAVGECRVWISYENAEKVVVLKKQITPLKDTIWNDNRMISSYDLDIKSLLKRIEELDRRIKELEEENAKLKKENYCQEYKGVEKVVVINHEKK